MSFLLRQGEPANDVAVLLPEDDAQAAFVPGHVAVTDEMKRIIARDRPPLILDAGYNLDYADATTINKLGLHHPVLILPPTTRIPLQTAETIAAYATHGGHVIAIGTLPTLAPGLKQQGDSPGYNRDLRPSPCRSNPGHHSCPLPSEVPAALHNALEPDLLLKTDRPLSTSDRSGGLGFIHRKLPTTDIYFIANSTNEPVSATASFRPTHRHAQAWSPDTGALPANVRCGPCRPAPRTLQVRCVVSSHPDPPSRQTTPKLLIQLALSRKSEQLWTRTWMSPSPAKVPFT